MFKKILAIAGLAALINFGFFAFKFSWAEEKKAIVDIFNEADSDKDGYISLEEARAANLLNEDTFKQADSDQDGLISLGEAKQSFSNIQLPAQKEATQPVKTENEIAPMPQMPAQLEQTPAVPPQVKPEMPAPKPTAQQKRMRPRPRFPYSSNRRVPAAMKRPVQMLPPEVTQQQPKSPGQNANQ